MNLPASMQAANQPIPTSESAAKMKAPSGFHVKLFAGEPDIVQPIAFTFDDRGRMWVVECLSYPKWSRDGTGKDRVVILEDTNGDGVHDQKTVFLENGVNLSGIEIGFGGVWLCSSPDLLFIPVQNDKPAGPPQVVLDGWNRIDTKHNVFNSLIWGPDGWLYGCNGIQSKSWVGKPGTPREQRTYIDCGVWKYHPIHKTFEVFATGTTNPWGLDFDEFGEAFITNCVIDHLFHFAPGGRYQRMYGEDANPYAFGLMSSCVDYKHWGGGHWTESRADQKTGALKKEHDDVGGGHAHSGCAIYLGDNFPKEFRNTLFTCNIHGNRLNHDALVRTPAGMKGLRRPDFLFANDPWFRGICVKLGPEGALYVSDWCDTGECHNYDIADVRNGRIYRIAYESVKTFSGDMSKWSTEELCRNVVSSNEWVSRKARRLLQERAARQPNSQIETDLAAAYFSESDPARQMRLIWALHGVNGLSAKSYASLADHKDDRIQGQALLLAADKVPADALLDMLMSVVRKNPSAKLRSMMASVMQRLPDSAKLTFAKQLFMRAEDNSDQNLTIMYWLGIQPAVLTHPNEALSLILSIPIERVRSNIVRLVLTLPKSEPTTQLDRVFPILRSASSDAIRRDILQGILLAFEDRKRVTPPSSWQPLYEQLDGIANDSITELADALALKFGDVRAVVKLKRTASDSQQPVEKRQRAISMLLQARPEGFSASLLSWLDDHAIRGAAIRGLASYSDSTIPARLLDLHSSMTASERADAVLTLASRPKFAMALLTAVESGRIPRSEISSFVARQILALNDEAVTSRLTSVWGTIKPASATRLEQTRKYQALLTPEYLKSANLTNGRQLYARACASCHKLFDEGGDVGPELTGSQRSSLDYLLENVLDPNAVVPFDYRMTQFNLSDGRVVTGLLKKETAQSVTVRTVNELIVLPKSDIESRKNTNQSVMPEGLLDTLSNEELRDLIAYLGKK